MYVADPCILNLKVIIPSVFLKRSSWQSVWKVILFDFSLTVKAAPHERVIRTGQP